MLLKLVAEGCFSAIAASFNPSFERECLTAAQGDRSRIKHIADEFV